MSNHATLDGGGGLRSSGRWHTRGRPIVYCSPNPATALLEVLVHAEIDVEDMPVAFRYLEIEAPDSISGESTVEGIPGLGTLGPGAVGPGVPGPAVLGPDWKIDLDATRRLGDEWLRAGRSALLRVPSVIVPATWNVLLNPQHPESAQIRIVRMHECVVDPRLAPQVAP